MTTSLAIGLGHGDEGKGHIVSALASRYPIGKVIVVRFNGGHQAGHTAVVGGHRHVFSSFGSGTLYGAPTIWSRYCTVYPTAFLNEHKLLESYQPRIYIDPLCPVTTPYDVRANRKDSANLNHGTVGVGFGKTIERHEKLKLHFQDLYNKTALRIKLKCIQEYYNDPTPFDGFLEDAQAMIMTGGVILYHAGVLPSFKHFDHMIFEGAQGVLLDMDHGFFPHVTRSHTTGRNAMEFIREHNLPEPDVYYITRAYQTRHGAGPMTYEGENPMLSVKTETNKDGLYQGVFRLGALDVDLLVYALRCAAVPEAINKHFVVTCMDHVDHVGRDCIKIGGGRRLYMLEEFFGMIEQRTPFFINNYAFTDSEDGQLK